MARRLVPLLLFALACGAERPPLPAAPSPRARIEEPAPATPPGRWVVRYRGASEASVPLDGDARVEVGAHGERWLVTPNGRVIAKTFFSEPIVAGARTKDGELAFATADGTIHPVSSADPLGPIGAPRKPPRPLARVTAGRNAIVGGAVEGPLLRTIDAGRTWTTVEIGGAPRVLASVALARDGTGALLQLPQRTLVTSDDGATFGPVPPPTQIVGEVAKVETSAGGASVIARATNDVRPARLATSPLGWVAATRQEAEAPRVEGPRFEYATAATRGEGVIAGTRWFEVVGTETGPELWTEALEENEPPRRLRTLPPCNDEIRVGAGASGRIVVVACLTKAKDVAVLRSEDGGAQWREERLRAATSSIGATASEHLVVIRGACTADRAQACPFDAAVSAGGSAFANLALDGAGAKTGMHLGLVALEGAGFVATGGDEESHTLVAVSADGGRRASITKRFDDYVGFRELSLDGDRAVALTDYESPPLWISRDRGRTWESRTLGLPEDAQASASFAGLRGLAMTAHGARETADGGATWTEVAGPRTNDGSNVTCGASACIAGDALRRIGWGSTTPVPVPVPVPVPAPTVDPPRAPILSCRTTGTATPLEGFLEPPMLDLDDGVRARIVVHEPPRKGAQRVRIVSERTGSPRASTPSIVGHPPLVLEVARDEHGVVVLEYPGRCAINCHGYFYTGTGPIELTWSTTRAPTTTKHASLTPDADAKNGALTVVVTAEGALLVSAGASTYLVDAGGQKKKLPGAVWDVVTFGGKSYAVSGAVTLREIGTGPPVLATAWSIDGVGIDRPEQGGIARVKGQPFFWAQVEGHALVTKIDRIEPEPTTIAGLDFVALLSKRPLPACRGPARAELRVAANPQRQPPIDLEIGGVQEKLGVQEAVLRVAPDGTACVSALRAESKDLQRFLLVYPDDLEHATLATNARKPPSSIQPASCR